MREQEMWNVVRSILGTTVRKVVLPASVGIGLALGAGGCDGRAPVTGVDLGGDGAVQYRDSGFAPAYAAPQPDSTIPAPRYAAVQPDAAIQPDGDIVAPMYGSPQPDYAAPYPETDAG